MIHRTPNFLLLLALISLLATAGCGPECPEGWTATESGDCVPADDDDDLFDDDDTGDDDTGDDDTTAGDDDTTAGDDDTTAGDDDTTA